MASLLVFDVDAERAGNPGGDDDDRIGDGEPVGAAVRRICAARVARAIDELAVPLAERDAGVHEARKSLKRARALIRLVRDTVGYRPYREINVVLRDCARRLAPVRDGAVMVHAVDRLADRNGIDARHVAATRDHLVAAHAAARAAVLADPATFTDTMTALRVAYRRLASWPVDDPGSDLAVPDDYSAIAGGVRRVYRRGWRGVARSGSDGSAAAFHDWRKRVKYLRHQMEALHNAWPEMMGATAAGLDTLGELLGEEHDYTVLQSVLDAEPPLWDPERRMLATLAAAEQTRLRAEALALGRRLYAERPAQFVARIGSYWEAWRGMPRHPAQDGPASGR